MRTIEHIFVAFSAELKCYHTLSQSLENRFRSLKVGPWAYFVYAPTEVAAALNYSACLAQLSARHQTIFCTLFFLVAAQSVGLSMKAAHKTSPSIPFLIAEISPL